MVSRTVATGSAIAAGLAAHTAWNLRALGEPDLSEGVIDERVSILIPARNEAENIAACVDAALAQCGVPNCEVIVLDDGSTDGTADILQSLRAGQSGDRLRVIAGTDEPPTGWLGKPWACQRLAEQATGTVLLFVDADVRLAPQAARAAVRALRTRHLDLLSAYPHQVSESTVERLVQPLLVWSWASTMPLTVAERSRRPSMSAANGQFMAFDRDAYWRIEGHRAVAGEVLEDIALMRAIKRIGGRGGLVNGRDLAECRMYGSASALTDGYAKSLWAAFGGPVGSVAVCATLALAYCLPAVAMVTARSPSTRLVGGLGYSAGVAGRAMVAQRTGDRMWPDAAAHPLSVAMFIGLNGLSWVRRARGTATWKGRHLP